MALDLYLSFHKHVPVFHNSIAVMSGGNPAVQDTSTVPLNIFVNLEAELQNYTGPNAKNILVLHI